VIFPPLVFPGSTILPMPERKYCDNGFIAGLKNCIVSARSPRWLVSRGRLEEAKKAMTYFRGELAKHVECELRDCEHQVSVL
jgi:hypothetical protein